MADNQKQHQFSLAICPPAETVLKVRELKLELSQQIGWFHSLHADAHITFNVFEADQSQINKCKKYLTGFCNTVGSFDIHLVELKSYPNGTVFLAPDKASKSKIAGLMKRFNINRVFPVKKTSMDPHLTIARGLNEGKLKIAFETFSNRKFDLRFTCNNVALRKLDKTIKQYKIDERFSFGEEKQLSLF